MKTSHILIAVAVITVGVGAYLMFFHKKVAAQTSSPPKSTSKQGAQLSLTGALSGAGKELAIAGVQIGSNAATNWLKDVSW